MRPTLVQTIATSQFGPPAPDPAGIVYIASEDRFLISDSEVDEMAIYQGSNLFTATRTGSGIGTGTTLVHASREPAGLGYNPADGTLFESDDDRDTMYVIRPGPDGRHGTTDDTRTSFSTTAFGSGDAEGVEYDTATGHLFVCDGSALKVFELDPVNGVFGDGNDAATSFSLTPYGARDCEGIGIDSQRDTLLAVDPSRRRIYELTKSGVLLRTLLLDQTVIPTTSTIFASVTMAPTSNPADSPTAMNYWLVDRHVDNGADPNENDGLLYELSLGSTSPPPDAPPQVTITNPADSAAVTGTRVVQMNASDDVGVDRVTVAVDGTTIGTDVDGSNGWSVAWDTTTTGQGAHTVTATAFDTANQSASDSNGVFVDHTPPVVAVSSPLADSTVSGVVSLVASATDNDAVGSVQFRVDGSVVGTDTAAAGGWSVSWDSSTVAQGQHTITAVATDRAGRSTTSDPVAVTVDHLGLVSIAVGTGSDDADELADGNGTVRRANGDIELGSGSEKLPTTAGLRFAGVSVPQGATILSAHVQFRADETKKTAANLLIRAQQSDNAPTFATTAFDISSRPRTSASVSWATPAWVAGSAGPAQRTPDLSAVLQELVNRPGWSAGNALAIIITGSGRRTAESFEGGVPPVLEIEYATP